MMAIPSTPPTRGSRLRIAFVYDALVPYCSGGAERRCWELAVRLARRHEVHYLTWGWWGDDVIERDGVVLHSLGRPPALYGDDGKRTIGEALSFAVRLPAALVRLDVDVIDVSATPYLPVYAAWVATRIRRARLVTTWHEVWGDHWLEYLPGRPLVARIARLVESAAQPLADRRVAVSRFTAGRLRRGRGSPPTDVVGNGTATATFGLPRRRATAHAGPATDLVALGRLIDEKRIDRLLEAVAIAARHRPGLSLTVIGDGPERARLEALVGELGIGGRVTFRGSVPDAELAPLLASGRLLVMPSDREGYGIAVVEGQAAGLVPIVVDGPMTAAPELIRHGVDGLVVDPTPEAIAAGIVGLLEDPATLAAMAAEARRAAASRDWDRRAEEIEGVYRRVVATRAAATAPAESGA